MNMTIRKPRVAYIVVDKQGIPLVGTKVCATKGGATNSMAPWVNNFVYDRLGYDSPMNDIHKKAQEGYGVPKLIHPAHMDEFVDSIRNTPTYKHKHGNKNITRQMVEEYNQVLEEIIGEWSVKKLEG